MVRVEHMGMISTPPEAVFPVISDPQTQLVWDAETLRSVEKLGGSPLSQGSRYRGRFRGFGTVEYEFVEFEPNRRFAHRAKIPLGTMTHTFTLEAADGGTRVTQVGELEPNVLGRLAGPMFRRNMAKRFATIVDEVSTYVRSH